MKGRAFNRILLITGEVSGDTYGYFLIKRIREINPAFHFLAIGGPKVRSLGVENLFSAENLALVGLPSLSDLKKYWFVYRHIKELLQKGKVDIVILVDFPGFNLRIAKLAKKLGYPVIYYVAPQVWAWNRRRIKILRDYVDRLYVILPFEKEFFRDCGINAIFLGHPLLDLAEANISKKVFAEVYGFKQEEPIFSFFPGSREAEVERHIPLFLEVWRELKKRLPFSQAVMVRCSSLPETPLWELARKEMVVVENTQYEVLKYSTVSVLASGTVTLEAAIMETPAVVTYRVPSLVYHLAKRLIKVPYISLPNLILKKEVYPEFLHGKEVAEEITNGVIQLFENEEKRENIKKLLREMKKELGPKGATWRIAEDVVNYINSLKSGSPEYTKNF